MIEMDPEIAKASAQLSTELVGSASRGLGVIFGDAAREVGHMLGDRVRLWRFKQLTSIMDQAQKIAMERGLPEERLKALPFGIALRVADASSNEDEPELQDLWARLIANAITGATDSIERAYIDLLKSLSPSEVTFLELLWRFHAVPYLWQISKEGVEVAAQIKQSTAAVKWAGLPNDSNRLALQNLQRLRCISIPAPQLPAFLTNSDYIEGTRFETLDTRKVTQTLAALCGYVAASGGSSKDLPQNMKSDPDWYHFKLTTLGAAFMTACANEAPTAPSTAPA